MPTRKMNRFKALERSCGESFYKSGKAKPKKRQLMNLQQRLKAL